MIKSKPILTVSIPVYNAEKFIVETLNSVFKQKTEFLFDVLIADDCSTDSTGLLVSEFLVHHKNIKYIRHESNLGMTKNQHFVVCYPHTEYIAYLDSDDFFSDEYYLQKQVDFLKENPSVACVFSNVENFIQGTNVVKKVFDENTKPPVIFDLHTYLKRLIPITNSAMVFRQKFNKNIPDSFTDYFQYDWLLHMHHGLNGDFGYNDFVGTRYRIHEDNATNIKNAEKKFLDGINLVYSIKKFLPTDFHVYFTHPIFEMNSLSFYYLLNKRYLKFLIWYFRWWKVTPFADIRFRDEFYKFRKAFLGKIA